MHKGERFMDSNKHLTINDLDLEYPADSPMWALQFDMYDRWLPFLANIIDDGYIVDVGANIGDTVAWMYPNTQAKFLCIEPGDEFYGCLKKNIARFPEPLKSRVDTLKVFISDNKEKKYSLYNHNGGNQMLETNDESGVRGVTLAEALNEKNIKPEDVKLIKIDTDGFDWRVIKSGGGILRDIKPLLYFEHEILSEESYLGYYDLAEYLQDNGYDCFFVFDNFGNFIGNGTKDFYLNLTTYLMRQFKYKTGRTIEYFDVVACNCAKEQVLLNAVQEYLKVYPV